MIFKAKQKKEEKKSEFSEFFHKAKSAEKKRVFLRVARKAAEDQRRIMKHDGA